MLRIKLDLFAKSLLIKIVNIFFELKQINVKKKIIKILSAFEIYKYPFLAFSKLYPTLNCTNIGKVGGVKFIVINVTL